MKIRKQIITGLIFLLLFVCPPLIYFYVTQGFNNFIKLEVIGESGHKIDDF